MTYARLTPLEAADSPLADRQSIGWAIFADTLFDRPEPAVLSWPCSECGQFEIVCDCTDADILADLEDIFGDGK